MSLPEDVCSVAGDALVIGISDLGLGEGWVLSNQNKKNYCSSKDIYLFALIWSFQVDFWCHIVQSSKLGVKISLAVLSIRRCSKSEISDLDIEILVEKQVLWLKISMSDLPVVAEVETLHKLLEEISSFGLSEL